MNAVPYFSSVSIASVHSVQKKKNNLLAYFSCVLSMNRREVITLPNPSSCKMRSIKSGLLAPCPLWFALACCFLPYFSISKYGFLHPPPPLYLFRKHWSESLLSCSSSLKRFFLLILSCIRHVLNLVGCFYILKCNEKVKPRRAISISILSQVVPFVCICSGLCWNILIDQAGGMEEKKEFLLKCWNVVVFFFFLSLKELRGKGTRESLVYEEWHFNV